MSTLKLVEPKFEIKTFVNFNAQESQPEGAFFLFNYKIQIVNQGHQLAQLMSRHWIITDGLGRVEEVRGPGVVGQQPQISPGKSFEYESACPLPTSSGSMRGFYQMQSQEGQIFQIEIPEFYLISPFAIH